jgi:hypothetical protein
MAWRRPCTSVYFVKCLIKLRSDTVRDFEVFAVSKCLGIEIPVTLDYLTEHFRSIITLSGGFTRSGSESCRPY